jgi:hypothetical protein
MLAVGLRREVRTASRGDKSAPDTEARDAGAPVAGAPSSRPVHALKREMRWEGERESLGERGVGGGRRGGRQPATCLARRGAGEPEVTAPPPQLGIALGRHGPGENGDNGLCLYSLLERLRSRDVTFQAC